MHDHLEEAARRTTPTQSRGERGQALVEFALVAPLQILIILFIIQAAQVLVARQVVTYAAFAAERAQLVGKDPHAAAALVCSAISPREKGPRLAVPGWGLLERSAGALARTRVTLESNPGGGHGQLSLAVEHDLRLAIPVVNLFLADRSAGGEYHLHVRAESVVYKGWSDEPPDGEGHPLIPDLPLAASARRGL